MYGAKCRFSHDLVAFQAQVLSIVPFNELNIYVDFYPIVYSYRVPLPLFIDFFRFQKPENIPGDCPFLSFEGPCPYGIACRFSGTHKVGLAETTSFQRKSSEVNGLSKDVQKLLWKDQMCFTRADAELKRLGLVVGICFYIVIVAL